MDIIETIKKSFLEHYKILGSTNEEIIDELDMAIYQHREIRGTPVHSELLQWGNDVLNKIKGKDDI